MSKQLADAWFEAFRNKDVTALENILTEDFVHTSPFGAIKSRKAYIDLVNSNPDAFFSSVITIIDMIDNDDKVAVRYTVDDMEACDCLYIRDGKISEIYAYYHYGDKPSF